MVTLLGGVLTVVLGGNLIKALLDFLGSRGKSKADVAVSMITSLQAENERLTKRLTELETELDKERRSRRELETRVAVLERDKREGT
jgi:FtsZ-binding cell division protein ZapB